jgi:hypothetical protein
MLLGWRARHKSAPGRRKRQHRQGEVSQASINSNRTYGALLAFRSHRTGRYRGSVATRAARFDADGWELCYTNKD